MIRMTQSSDRWNFPDRSLSAVKDGRELAFGHRAVARHKRLQQPIFADIICQAHSLSFSAPPMTLVTARSTGNTCGAPKR
jgi:hypothetical protein